MQAAYLEKITSIEKRDYLLQKNQAFEIFIDLLFHKFDQKDYKNFLDLNKPLNQFFIGLSEA